MWSGLPLSPEQALSQYDIDACLPSTDLPTHLAQLALQSPAPNLYATGTEAEYIAAGNPLVLRTDFTLLKDVIDEARVVKDEYEIAALRHANKITAQAHQAVREKIANLSSNSETEGSERELEAVFTERCIALGAPKQAYHGIFGAGENAATLHYVHNDQPLQGRKNVLVDAAAEWECYCADVTRTYPLRGHSGSFDEKSQAVYDIVAEMQARCIEIMKAGVAWEEVHLLAHRVATKGLLRLGILRGASEEELVEKKMSVPFFPHGLGHYLGLDTHDVGGHPDYDDQDEVFRYLRVRGKLPENSVVTVEPGMYFCRFLIEPVLSEEGRGKYIDRGVLDGYWDVGGVRIEDDVVIRKDGVENLTVAVK
ncbi:MAG: hypothetical protein LQ351_002742 [Letrouitia transgressa]|nr:MAG: hypothetical protein LQ351_002742 [Letrouitia transgressa]